MNVIEVGSNNGEDTIEFSKNSNVWCFEPNPFFVNILNEKFRDNSNVKIIQSAVGERDGESVFNISKDGLSSSLNNLSDFSISNELIEYVSQITVNVTRMDTFVTNNNIEVVDYFHCDAQGDDLKVLKSFGDKLHIIKKGVIEITKSNYLYESATNSLENCVNFLTNNDFVIVNLPEILKSKSYDCNLKFHKKTRNKLI